MPPKQRMRVLILANLPIWKFPGLSHYSADGGNSTWLESLFPYFGKQSELDVHWLVMSKDITKPEKLTLEGQTIHLLPRWKKSFSMISRYKLEIRRIRIAVKQINPDVLHAWGSEDVYGISGAAVQKPKCFTLQGCLNDYLRKMGGPFLFRLQTALEIPTICQYTHATAETPLAEEQLLELNPALKTRIIDYGVHTRFHETIWNPNDRPLLFFAGSINGRKGVPELIEAYRRMNRPDIELRIAGNGELTSELKRTSPEGVVWLGNVKNDVIMQELSKCWAFVMPTHADTGPTAVKEARVVGCPVITTHQAGAKCYIDHGHNGYLLNAGDVDSLSAAMINICTSRDIVISMGKHKHEETKESLHPSRSVSLFSRLYKTLMIESGT